MRDLYFNQSNDEVPYRVNMNSYTQSYNFGYLSTDDRLKGNDKPRPNIGTTMFFCNMLAL